MSRITILTIIGTLFLIQHSAIAYDFEWPDTTLVNWNGISNRVCYEQLVYCLLAVDADSSDFIDTVGTRSGTIWWWNSSTYSCIVEVPGSADLATEATAYDNCPLTRYAAPLTHDLNYFAPEDIEYLSMQWYLNYEAEQAPEGYDTTAHINWELVYDLPQRGHGDVVMAVLDAGIAMTPGGQLSHGDLGADQEEPRVILGENYRGGNFDDMTSHGTMVASLMAADPNNTFDNPYDEEGDIDNWGMVGVNTVSNILIYKHNATHEIACEALWHFVRREENSPHVINFSFGGYPMEGEGGYVIDEDQIELWETTFNDIIDSDFEMPLLCISSGNVLGGRWDEDDGVAYPARFAFSGSLEGYEKGYPFILSVGATDYQNNKTDYSVYTGGSNHVSVVAPGGNINDDPEGSQLWAAKNPRHNMNHNFFGGFSGTSCSAPLVAGVASLVLSAAIDDEDTLTAYELRRIIEKTARDVNYDDKPYFDDEMGFGLVDCFAAVTNRDLYTWQLEENTWYYISSNVAIDDAFDKDTIPRVLEEITLDNNDYDNGLLIINSYDVQADSACVWKPGVREDNIGDWNVQRMYQIKLNDEDKYTDTLWICGQTEDIIADIFLYDTDSTSGWNWVAYYPDYQASADSALLSIAAPGDVDSALYLVKGQDGSFYSVDYSFCNLTMKPGEGYQMQLDEDVNDTLNYPPEDPDGIIERRKGSGEDLINTPQHFRFSSRTGDFLPILITRVALDNRFPAANDEIGIFIADTLCIGAGLWQEGLIGFAAWMDDETTQNLDGFRNFNSLTFRYWDDSENEEIGQIGVETAAAAGSTKEPSILVKELNFDGPVRKPEIPEDFALGPIYPNPFNSSTNIHYSLPSSRYVSLLLFDLSGRKIRTLYTGYAEAGKYRISLNGINLPSGLYFIHFNAGSFEQTRKLELIR